MKPTQNDVAKEAGVSRSTVSYVLNNTKSGKVPISDETRDRVLSAMKKLKYEPDARAQMLRSGKTMTVGLLIPDLQNPHYWQYLSGVESEAHRNGYTLLLYHSAMNREEEGAGLRELSRKRVDGLIAISAFTRFSEIEIRELSDRKLPVVDFSMFDTPFDCVKSDYRESTLLLMEHLLKLGHSRIAFVYGVPDFEIGLDRLEPYRDSLRAAEKELDDSLIAICGTTIEEGYKAAVRLLEQPARPTAIVAVNDLLALGVLRAASDRGISVPRDLSVAGFDDIPFAQYVSPRLTTVHHDTEQAGQFAFRMLMDRIRNPDYPRKINTIASHLIVRESTGPVPNA